MSRTPAVPCRDFSLVVLGSLRVVLGETGSRAHPALGLATEQDVNIGTKKYEEVVCMGI